LFDEPVRRILAQAAAEAGLDRELGALRLVLARLLMEDDDPVRQAVAVTRVATAARIVRTQAAVGGQRDTLQEWIHEVLTELDLAEREGRIPARADDGVGELPTYGLRAFGEKAVAGVGWEEEEGTDGR
jgi:hypothetical protein